MKSFKEYRKYYIEDAKNDSISLTEEILTYLNINFDYEIVIDEERLFGLNDETIHPENGCSYCVNDEEFEVCCFFVTNGKYIIMVASDDETYFEGDSLEEFEQDFKIVEAEYQDWLKEIGELIPT